MEVQVVDSTLCILSVDQNELALIGCALAHWKVCQLAEWVKDPGPHAEAAHTDAVRMEIQLRPGMNAMSDLNGIPPEMRINEEGE